MHSKSQFAILFAFVLVLFSSTASAEQPNTLKVYLLIGQSNMEGKAFTYDNSYTDGWNVVTMEFLLSGTPASKNYVANMPYSFKSDFDSSWLLPREDVWAVHYNSSNGSNRGSLSTRAIPQDEMPKEDRLLHPDIVYGVSPLRPGFGSNTNFGSQSGTELAMGYRIGDALGSPVFMFKSDKGGTDLANNWRPPSAVAARGGTVGTNYTNTINKFTEFLDTLDTDLAGDGLLNDYNNATDYEIVGCAWMQGWNTTNGSCVRGAAA